MKTGRTCPTQSNFPIWTYQLVSKPKLTSPLGSTNVLTLFTIDSRNQLEGRKGSGGPAAISRKLSTNFHVEWSYVSSVLRESGVKRYKQINSPVFNPKLRQKQSKQRCCVLIQKLCPLSHNVNSDG